VVRATVELAAIECLHGVKPGRQGWQLGTHFDACAALSCRCRYTTGLLSMLAPLQSGCDLAVVLWGETPAAAVQTSHPTKLSVLTYDELLAKVAGLGRRDAVTLRLAGGEHGPS